MSKSTFYLVECKDGSQKVVFSHTNVQIKDSNGEIIAEPTGGRAVIFGKIIKELDSVNDQ